MNSYMCYIFIIMSTYKCLKYSAKTFIAFFLPLLVPCFLVHYFRHTDKLVVIFFPGIIKQITLIDKHVVYRMIMQRK